MVKYSVCITHRNMNRTIRPSLASVIRQLDEDFEVVVVDALSDDGSEKYLGLLSDGRRIRLFREGCSRGRGRDLAAKMARGDILIQQVDMDVVYRDVFRAAVERFLELEATGGRVCLVWTGSGGREVGLVVLTVCRRELVEELGGWPDLNHGEDTLFWLRASKVGSLVIEFGNVCYAHLVLPWHWRWRDSLAGQERAFRAGMRFYDVFLGTRYGRSWKLLLRMPLTVLAFLRARSRGAPRPYPPALYELFWKYTDRSRVHR